MMNMIVFRQKSGFVGALLFFGLTACATISPVDKTGALALNHLALYEREVNTKIAVENLYYDRVLENATNRIIEIRNQEHIPELLKKARVFAQNYGAESSQGLFNLANSAMTEWATREQEFDSLLDETRDTLTLGRKELALQKGKITELRNKLRVVSSTRSTDDMLKLLVAFSQTVGTELENAKKEANDSSKTSTEVGNSIVENTN